MMASDAFRKKSQSQSLPLHRDATLETGQVEDLLQRARDRNRPVSKSIFRKFLPTLHPDDEQRIRSCMRSAIVTARDQDQVAHASAARCKHYLCPYCPPK